MRIVLLFIPLLFQILLVGQSKTNVLITFDDINPNPLNLVKINDENYLFSSINFIGSDPGSTIISIDLQTNNYNQINLANYSLTRKSIDFDGSEKILIYGDDNSEGPVFIGRLSLDFDIEFLKTYETNSNQTGASAAMFFNGQVYGGAVDEFEEGNRDELNLKKFDLDGNELWSHNFGQDSRIDFIYEIDSTHDSNLILSSEFEYLGDFTDHPKLMKLDLDGNEIWTTISDEISDRIVSPLYIAQLSNQNIVQTYKIDRPISLEIHLNPIRLKFYNKDGDPISQKLIEYPHFDNMSFRQIEAGKGDYFFAYGGYTDDDLDRQTFNLLIKFDLEGNEIWRRRYQHPDFIDPVNSNSIRDIEELDNGNIMIFSGVSTPVDWNKMWLFEVDADGCHDPDTCDDINIITTSTQEIDATPPQPIIAYPNPSDGIVNINADILLDINVIELYNSNGSLIQSWSGDIPAQLDLRGYPQGIYMLKSEFNGHNSGLEKLILR